MQMKMFLTRLGENSRMIITGDPSQVDLPNGQTSGLAEAARLLDGVEGRQWDHVTLLSEASGGEPRELKLTKSVPVIWTYMTAWAGPDGLVRVRPDVYHYDDFDPDSIKAVLN